MSERRGGSFEEVFALLEKHGAAMLPARSLEQAASTDVRAALHAAGVIAAAPAAASWPCDIRGCAREVRSSYAGARRPLLAVCSQVPAACMPVELGFDDVAQQQLSVEALLVATCGLLGADLFRTAFGRVRERLPLGSARAPILIATVVDPATDVFWAGSPRDTDLATFCARREHLSRASLVLVPTTRHVPDEVSARFGPRENVEVRSLADWLEVTEGRLSARRHSFWTNSEIRDVARIETPSTQPGLAGQLGVTRWEEIRLTELDGHTLRVEANGKALLKTFVELGFVDRRKTGVVMPVQAWALLLVFCREGGRVKPSAYGTIGKPYAVKKAVEAIGKRMKVAFGIEEAPIRTYEKRDAAWVARFRVGEGKGGG